MKLAIEMTGDRKRKRRTGIIKACIAAGNIDLDSSLSD